MPPETIAGRYHVERAIGRGGMGTVWLCRDEVLGREVAVKQVGLMPGESAPDLARALREARSSAALNHPHVVSVYDAVEVDDHIWLVMEYVPGSTLSELMAREGRLDPERVAYIGAQVADGLAAAHARGTVHRDVKPGNVLIDGEVAKISDFGIARTAGDAQLTQTGMVMGTPLYFSPQLARGLAPTRADDVWALGATLYAAVEGSPPIEDRGNAIATLTAIAEARPAPPAHAGFLTDAIGRMLDPDPVSRWSMADAAHALRRLHEQHRAPATLETAPRRPGPDTPVAGTAAASPPDDGTGHRTRWPLVVALVVLLLVGGVAAAAYALRSDDPSGGSSAGHPKTSTSRSSTPSGEPSTATATVTTTATAPVEASPTGSVPVATDPEQAVEAYYGLLPDDTEDAWQMLGPQARASAHGYGNYAAFWGGIESVEVGGTSLSDDVVSVELTYNGDDSETRQLRMEKSGAGWIIAEDIGTG
ncbi:serine/threonine-protein kinase [Nocardioides sp. URHA0032]|uniref:serine/threonine-protein kinase n=1 Tax=Nocardioides sp. URHA0032 TaxID=1380388 RepID=UPI0006882699|nr:serine/threonine-protein kinase [Nocardioides sp. URHA0032]